MPTFPLIPANPSNIYPAIIDQYGNEVRDTLPRPTRGQLTEPAIGNYDSLLQYAMSMPGYHPDALIAHRGWGLADSMWNHSGYMIPYMVMVDALLFKGIEVRPAVESKKEDPARYDRAKEAAKFCDYLITHILDPETDEHTDFRTVIQYMAMALHQGYSVQEVLCRWYDEGPYKEFLGLKGFAYKKPVQLAFWLDDQTFRPRWIRSYTPRNGWQEAPLSRFLYYRYHERDGLPYGWGHFRPAHRHVVVLDMLTKLWSIILERFAGGFMIGHYASPKEQNQLMAAFEMMKRGAGIALPEGMLVELQQMGGNGVEQVAHAIEYHRRAITEIMIGQSLTTSQGEKGSYAHAEVHQNTQEYKLAAARRDIEFIVQTLFYRFIQYNLGNNYLDVIPKFSLGVWDWSNTKLIAETMKLFVDMGSVGGNAPFIRARAGLPPFDPDQEEIFTVEPGKERVNVDADTKGQTVKPAKTSPKASRAKGAQPVLHAIGQDFTEMEEDL